MALFQVDVPHSKRHYHCNERRPEASGEQTCFGFGSLDSLVGEVYQVQCAGPEEMDQNAEYTHVDENIAREDVDNRHDGDKEKDGGGDEA